jgi:hypothetical protein
MNRLLRYLVHGWGWLLALGLIILSAQLSGPDGPLRYQVYAEHVRNIPPYTFSGDGRLLLLNGQVIRLPDGQVQRIVDYGRAAFSANGAILAAQPPDDQRDVLREGHINLFRTNDQSPPVVVQVADGAVIQRFEGTKGDMQLPAFTPDGQQIMTSIGSRPGLLFWQVAPRAPWNIGLRLLPALIGLLLLLEQVRRFIVRGMRRPT